MFFSVPPRFTQWPYSKTVLENEDVEFTCSAYGRPEPSITWRRIPGQTVVGKGPKYIKKNVQRTDQGVYQCDVGNGVEQNITGNVFLKVNCKYPLLVLLCACERERGIGVIGEWVRSSTY